MLRFIPSPPMKHSPVVGRRRDKSPHRTISQECYARDIFIA
jgi:hypothetical protein